PDESGEDDSPRFDAVLDLPPVQDIAENFKRRLVLVEENRTCNFDAPFCMKNFFWVKDVPFNAIMVENLRALARIAERLDRTYDAEFFDREAGLIAAAMRELMFEDGAYWPTHGEHYEKIKVTTWAVFAPLFAKLYEPEEAKALVARYLRDERAFSRPFIIPTVSRADPSYDPDGFWRGPVWISTNWFVYQGLRAYGFTEEAARVRDASLALIESAGFREHFNPETGKGQGAEEFTWGTLVTDMMDAS
ncbi:MAG: trehalase family glycosidase, partial [bacterium]|nr:trehalase family glycosidase [bacterium]